MDQPAPSLVDHYSNGYFDPSQAFVTDAEATGAPASNRYGRYRINPEFGDGWTDMHQFDNGLMLGRMRWRLTRALEDDYVEMPRSVCLGFMVSGVATTYEPSGRSNEVAAGTLFLRNDGPCLTRRRAPPGPLLSGISIDLPGEMLVTMKEQGVKLGDLGTEGTFTVFKGSPTFAGELSQIGARLLALDCQQSLLRRIELESLALELLLKLLAATSDANHPVGQQLAGKPLAGRWQVALDDAMDIVHSEWQQPLTIAQLARRAGINECYLKTLFRERTGQGVAGYLRSVRMQRARDLLRSGQYSVQQVAALCGYAHSGKFTEAFRKIHGVTPSRIQGQTQMQAQAQAQAQAPTA